MSTFKSLFKSGHMSLGSKNDMSVETPVAYNSERVTLKPHIKAWQ